MDTNELYKLYQQHPQITTDSRDCPADSIFVALKGDSFDGNLYAVQALEKGCSYAIVDNTSVIEGAPASLKQRLILVDDSLQTLKDIAREHRRQFHIPVIGITGTNGKTTTKELIATVLSEKYNVLYTQGNFNNDVGVPKTLLRLNEQHNIAVVEMGASHPGDIKTLVETVEPTCGLITNVGRAHLQGFGSFEGVMKTKGELYDFLAPDSEVFINIDNDWLRQMAEERQLTTLTCYGQSNRADIALRGEVLSCAPFLHFRWRTQHAATEEHGQWNEVRSQLIGAYNIDNMLAAIAVGLRYNVEAALINRALENYAPSNNRSQLTVTENNKLIVDAYNANPTSMMAALKNFEMMDVKPKMAILGMMGELGDVSREEHEKIVSELQRARFDEVWLVGEAFENIHPPFTTFHDIDGVKAAVAQQLPKNFYILIKGSNATRLWQLPELL